LVFPVILSIGIIVRLLFWAGYQGRDDSYYIIHASAFADRGAPGIEYTQRWIGRSGFWLPMSLSIKLFGAREFAFGLYPFLASLAGLLLAYRMGIALFDRRTGALAMLRMARSDYGQCFRSTAFLSRRAGRAGGGTVPQACRQGPEPAG
jgi:4-amino-4-deoxy-L-arabinose transferase-like glycosyltransferase